MKWLREPLVHFLLIGAALFGAFAVWGGPVVPPASQYHIVVTPTMVQNLAISFQDTEKHPPNAQELDTAIEGYVKEEILVREAQALNLGQDDPAVRRQLSGAILNLLQENAAVPTPTDAQLNDYLQKNADTFRNADGSLPTLADATVRKKAEVLWQYEQRQLTANAAYEKLRAHYVVDIQMPAATTSSSAPAAPANSTVQ
jgi:hypothetical protein